MPRGIKTKPVTGKTTALGAFTVSLSGYEAIRKHQVAVVVSATPAAGTLTVDIRTPGSTEYVNIGSIDLVNGPYVVTFEAFADSLQFTPVLFDAAKSLSVYVVSANEVTHV